MPRNAHQSGSLDEEQVTLIYRGIDLLRPQRKFLTFTRLMFSVRAD
jgi:hypothetical protein